MRHRKKGKRLGRPMAHRDAVMKNLVREIFLHGRIKTTITKAKMLRPMVEPIITRAKKGTLHDRREASRVISDKKLLKKIFSEVAPLYADRKGGYTRILRLGNRAGDNAPLVIIELIDWEKVYKKEDKDAKKGKEKEDKGKSKSGEKIKAAKAPKEAKEAKADKKEKPAKKEKKQKTEK
mgnify:CR=1 FL=1